MTETSCPSHLQIVKRGHHDLNPKTGLLSLPEELQFDVLHLLSCRDILRCKSVCKALRQMYTSSSDLQYIVELSGQRLLPVPNTNNHIPISERLQLLRDKAHAWFKFNPHSFQTVSVPDNNRLYYADKTITREHLCLWNSDAAAIIPILPKSPQQTVERLHQLNSLISVSHSDLKSLAVLMDLAQNLIVVAHQLTVQGTPHIDLRALDGGVHPQAAGSRLLLSEPLRYEAVESAKLRGFGRHIALQRIDPRFDRWHLQIWDWQRSTTSNCFFNGEADLIDFCFLGNNRLLVASESLKLYSIEDMSRAPQLLACFLLPTTPLFTPDILKTEPQMHAQQMYTSNPEHQLLCITYSISPECDPFVFIISTSVFSDLDETAVTTPIPWDRWGPSNSRVFEQDCNGKIHLSGSRVLQVIPAGESDYSPSYYIFRMMDFSPLAEANSRGLGRVVKETSVIDISGITKEARSLITSLPYVEFVSDKVPKGTSSLANIWIDTDRIYTLIVSYSFGSGFSNKLEVIDI